MPLTENEKKDAEKLLEAHKRFNARDLAGTARLAAEVAKATPKGYSYETRDGEHLWVRCWDLEEFIEYTKAMKLPKGVKKVLWGGCAYSHAHFLLGYIAMEQGRYADAIKHYDDCIRLDPDRVIAYTEKAGALAGLKQPEKAIRAFEKALAIKRITQKQKALALRGLGVNYIELGDYRKAEEALAESLKLDPTNRAAMNELMYIRHLERGGEQKVLKLKKQFTKCRQCGLETPTLCQYDGVCGMCFDTAMWCATSCPVDEEARLACPHWKSLQTKGMQVGPLTTKGAKEHTIRVKKDTIPMGEVLPRKPGLFSGLKKAFGGLKK